MLTAFQVETAAYVTEDGELLCPDCFDRGGDYAKPVERYSLDEWQAANAEDYDWSYDPDADPDVDHEQCEPALYDENGHELLEAYHDGHEDIEPTNPPVARWVPCSACGAGDGEPHNLAFGGGHHEQALRDIEART